MEETDKASDIITFGAEVVKIQQKKLASTDWGYEIVLHTGDMGVLQLSLLKAKQPATYFKISIQPDTNVT